MASSGVGDPDIAAWGALSTGGGLFVWDYVVNYKHAVQPFPNYFALAPRYQWYARHGVTGIYSEGYVRHVFSCSVSLSCDHMVRNS